MNTRPTMPILPSMVAAGLGLPHGVLVGMDRKSGRTNGSPLGEWQVRYSAALVAVSAFSELAGIVKNHDITTTGMLSGLAGLSERFGVAIKHHLDRTSGGVGVGAYVAAAQQVVAAVDEAYRGRQIEEHQDDLAVRARAAKPVVGRVLSTSSAPVI